MHIYVSSYASANEGHYLGDLEFLLHQYTDYLNIEHTRLHYLDNQLTLKLIGFSHKVSEKHNVYYFTQDSHMDMQAALHDNTTHILQ